jgi:hypothetical protein
MMNELFVRLFWFSFIFLLEIPEQITVPGSRYKERGILYEKRKKNYQHHHDLFYGC